MVSASLYCKSWERLISGLVLVLLICCKNNVKGQTNADAGLWTTATVEHSFNHKLGIFVTEEMRLKENFTRLNLFYTNIGLEYKIVKNLKTSLSYRPIQKYMPDNTFSYRHRLQWDVVIKRSSGNFEFSYRHRLQAEVRNVNSSDRGRVAEWFTRNKFQVKYEVNKHLAPYFSIELRYQVFDPRNSEFDHDWHRVRYQAGIDYKYNSRHSMGIYYLKQDEFNITNPQPLYILGLEYTFKI